MASSKGKEIVWEESYGKRKRDDNDRSGDKGKRKNRGVLQFFDDIAYVDDEDEDSDEDDFLNDFLEDEFKGPDNVLSDAGKSSHLPVLPKEEEITEEEFDKILEERYKPGSGLVTYAEDVYESSSLNQGNAFMLSTDPTIWKVKCMVGRERSSAFCLMQKYVDLHSLGTKLRIISACSLDHVKGFIYIEAERQVDLNEACKGICTIYPSRVTPVSKNEVSHLFTVRSKNNEVSVGTWARVKNGKYKGDLAQVMAVDQARKKATVKLIPRVDLQALAEKYGGGISMKKKTANPAPKLISSTELEEFRPLIQYRRDRDIGQTFEVLDGLMLKDGYLFKKVPIDSLSFWGVMPTEDELLKFEPSSTIEEPDCQEFLTELYGEPKKKPCIKSNKGGGKGEGSSSSGTSNSFEVHDLVLFNKKEFGVVVGSEKDDYFKVLKEGSEGPVAVTVEQRQLKNASFDKKLTALDHRKRTVSINDTVRVLEGPLQGREGIVKQVYRGIIFLCDENEQENSGYVCCKSQICEKVKLSDGACKGKGDESGNADFGDPMSSPKSPLSPKKPWQTRENNNNFNREGKDGMFSVGQSLRIRVGPLKGYLCRVLAVRRFDITVKLDSQHKILTVKQEHLSEVRGKSSAVSIGNDGESAKPFDFLGTQDSSGDWMAGAGTSADGERSGAAERTPWPTFSSSAFSRQPESSSAQAGNSGDINKDVGDAAWDSKMTSNQNTTSWGGAVGSSQQAAEGSGWKKASTEEGSQSKTWGNTGNDGGTAGMASGASNWGKQDSGTSWNKQGAGSSRDNQDGGSSWGKQAGGSTWTKPTDAQSVGESKETTMKNDSWNKPSGGVKTDWGSGGASWGKTKGDQAGSSDAAASTWGRIDNGSNNQSGGWKKSEESIDKAKNVSGSWSNASAAANPVESWGTGRDSENDGSTWGKAAESVKKGIEGSTKNSWGSPGNSKPSWNASSAEPKNQIGGWGNAGKNLDQPDAGGSGWKKASNEDGGQTKSWGNTTNDGAETGRGATSWGKQDSGTWNKQDAGSSLDNQAGGSSWGKQAGGSSWTKPTDVGPVSGSNENDSWAKAAEKSTKDDTGGKKAAWNSSSSGAETQTGGWGNGGGSGKQDGGSSWKSQAGGSSWTKQTDGNAGGDSWGKPSGGGRGFGGWNQNKDDGDQPGWDSGKSFDGGRGSGGRRGRGGRDQFGRGGSFGRGQSSDWSKDDQGYGGGSRPSWGKPDNSEEKDNGGGASAGSWGSGPQKWGSGDSSGGGFGGRGDRGGYGGRGDRGGFGGRGERGGFGGRGDRGGFGGRGDRGGFGGRGDRGGFRGRGDFGGRGRGRRDQNDGGDWNSRNDSGGEGWKNSNGGGSWGNDGGSSGWKASTGGGAGNSWGKSNNEGDGGSGGASGGWKQSNSTADGGQSSGGWNQPKGAPAKSWGNAPSSGDGGNSGGWKQGNSADGGQSSGGWNKPKGASDTANTWGKSNEGGGGGASGGWKQANSGYGGQSSGGWNKPQGASNGANTWGGAPSSSSWGKSNEGGGGSGGASGGWKSNSAGGGQSSGGWNQPKKASAPKETPAAANTWGKSNEGGSGDGGTWKQPNAADAGKQSSGWNQSKDAKEPSTDNAGGQAAASADPWAKASSWDKGNGGGGSSSGSGKGGW